MVAAATAALQTGCERVPALGYLQQDQPGGTVIDRDNAPIINVGQIMKQTDVGAPRYVFPRPSLPLQLRCVAVRIENVMRGTLDKSVVAIYYFSDMQVSGPPRMGLAGQGGSWPLAGRAIFFLKWDKGVLRTIYDIWASAAPVVLTGAHPGYKVRRGQSMAEALSDIQLDKGQGCDDRQQARAIYPLFVVSTDLGYLVSKLRQIEANSGPLASAAAKKELALLSYGSPELRNRNSELRNGNPGKPSP